MRSFNERFLQTFFFKFLSSFFYVFNVCLFFFERFFTSIGKTQWPAVHTHGRP